VLWVLFDPADTGIRNNNGVAVGGGGGITEVEMFLTPGTIGDNDRTERANQGITRRDNRGHELVKSWKA
jgi:hypothetical protein